MSEIASNRHKSNKVIVRDKEDESSHEDRGQEAIIALVYGHTYASLETFALRFNVPIVTLAQRVGELLRNAQPR